MSSWLQGHYRTAAEEPPTRVEYPTHADDSVQHKPGKPTTAAPKAQTVGRLRSGTYRNQQVEVTDDEYDHLNQQQRGRVPVLAPWSAEHKAASVAKVKVTLQRLNKVAQRPTGWQHPDAAEYAGKLRETYGDPDIEGDDRWIWKDAGGFPEIEVRDEAIPHDFPEPHEDFVYAKRANIKLTPEHVRILAETTGSITVDGLKNEVTARCGMMAKNAVSLGFAEDVAAGEVDEGTAKAEYARRIKADEVPGWYDDILQEVDGLERRPAPKVAAEEDAEENVDIEALAYDVVKDGITVDEAMLRLTTTGQREALLEAIRRLGKSKDS